MKIMRSAQKKVQKLPSDEAIRILNGFMQYEEKQHGYVKWLENRPGYRIILGKYRVIFELKDGQAIILDILNNKAAAPGPT